MYLITFGHFKHLRLSIHLNDFLNEKIKIKKKLSLFLFIEII